MNSGLPPTDAKVAPKSDALTFNRVFLKGKYSLYSAIVFFLFANPETLLILQKFFGKIIQITTPSGAPTVPGIFLSTLLFFLTMLGLMLVPSD